MDIKVIFSSGGKFNKHLDQKIADNDTNEMAKLVTKTLSESGHTTQILKITPAKIGLVKKIKADAVFNLCEWSGKDYPLGVDVLKALESKSVPYTGADSRCYEWCCNKFEMKRMFDKLNILTPPWVEIGPDDNETTISNKISSLNFPIIAKPAFEHCAIGINKHSVIHNKKSAPKKITYLLKTYKEPVLVEEFIRGREFTVTVLKNKHLHIFPPAEIIFKNKNKNNFLFFESQWTEKIDPYTSIVLNNTKTKEYLKKIAKKVFLKMGCKGYVRIDLRYRSGKAYILEVNVNPGLTPFESYGLTVSTQAAGWNFDKLINEIAQSAVTHTN